MCEGGWASSKLEDDDPRATQGAWSNGVSAMAMLRTDLLRLCIGSGTRTRGC